MCDLLDFSCFLAMIAALLNFRINVTSFHFEIHDGVSNILLFVGMSIC